MFVAPGCQTNIFQEAPGLATSSPRLIFNDQLVHSIKSLPFVKDVIPEFHSQVQLNINGYTVNSNIIGTIPSIVFTISPTVKLYPGSKIDNNNPDTILVGYHIANPPGYPYNPLIKVGQTITVTYGNTYRHFRVSGVLKESGNGNVDQIVAINRNTANLLFNKQGRYDTMVVFARTGGDVATVAHEMTSLYGSMSFGITTPAAIIQAQKHTQSGSASFTLEIGYIALMASGIGVVTTLWTSVNERTKEIGTMKAIGAKPLFILTMFLSDAIIIGLTGSIIGIAGGIGLTYVLAVSGASGGGTYIEPIFLPSDLIRTWILTLIISLAAGIFPAWKASRLSPLEALRSI
jgi:putative ABC transport system permease protein